MNDNLLRTEQQTLAEHPHFLTTMTEDELPPMALPSSSVPHCHDCGHQLTMLFGEYFICNHCRMTRYGMEPVTPESLATRHYEAKE